MAHGTNMEGAVNDEVIITCAVTGAGDTVGLHPAIPVTPEEIAGSALDAARAGAAIVHIHVREPGTGAPSRRLELYRDVVRIIRASDVDAVINLTTGMGGDLIIDDGNPTVPGAGTDLVSAMERLQHVEDLLPEMCSLDCGSMNFYDSDLVVVNTPLQLRAMARRLKELGVRPELEVFDIGHVRFAVQLIEEGLVQDPPLFQLCLGIPWGAPADTRTMLAMVELLPVEAQWAAFAISRFEMPFVAQSMLLGGHVRVGLEDNLYLRKGVFATNPELVEHAANIVRGLGARILTASEARTKLGLNGRTA